MAQSDRWLVRPSVVVIASLTGCARSTLGPSSEPQIHVAPEPVNQVPVITSLTVRGSKSGEPEQFADLDESVSVSASISDAETPVSDLRVEWSADAGSFTGNGPNVIWTAPHDYQTPTGLMLALTVTEYYDT